MSKYPLHVYVIRSHITVSNRARNVELLTYAIKSRFPDVKIEMVDGDDDTTLSREKIVESINLSKLDTTKDTNAEIFNSILQSLHVRNVSNCIKHANAIKSSLNSPDIPALIIEDDAIFGDKMPDMLVQQVEDLSKQKGEHIRFLCLPSPVNTSSTSQSLIPSSSSDNKLSANFIEHYNVAPTNTAYLVLHANMLANQIIPMKFSTNIQLSYVIQSNPGAITASFACPALFIDGSKLGSFPSSIEANNTLSMHPSYIRLFNKIEVARSESSKSSDVASTSAQPVIDTGLTIQDLEDFRKEVKEYTSSPDMIYLEARVIAHLKSTPNWPDMYREHLSRAFDEYTRHNCVMGNASKFLNEYIDSFAPIIV